MSIKLVDFKDLQDAILEEMKIQSSDTVTLARIKRVINEVYINEVVPHTKWKWLEGHTKVRFKEAYSGGTASVTPSSSTITLSANPAASYGSFAGYYFSVSGHAEVYIIDSHTAESTTVTLTSPFLGTVNSTASFKIWTDKVALPTDCRETVTVWHNQFTKEMEPMGWQKFRELSIRSPKAEGYPRVYYTGDYVGDVESSRYRELRIHPAIYSTPVTISIDYIKEVAAMSADGDEPALPLEDRIVLKYGALATLWRSVGRNPEEASISMQEFQNKLARMSGKIEDSQDFPKIQPDSFYMKRRRAGRYRVGAYSSDMAGGGSGGNSTNTQFLQDAIIQGAQLTANMTVDTGITIDGVDISVLEDDFAAHLVDAVDAHDASAISSIPSGNLAATDVQTALNELQTELDGKATSSEITDHINDATDAHDASAISFSPVGTIAATDAQAAIAEVATDAASALSTHESDTTSIHGIADTSLLVTTTGAQVLTAKDIDGGTASNTSRITVPKASKATLDALTRKEATVVYASDTDKLYYDDGSILKLVGSGSGGAVNFITDGDAEGANIWTAYADAAASRPVDGTGGTPNVTATISATTPLAGTNSFVFTKDAANRQGQGIATTFSVDLAYRAKVCQIEFDYIVGSGTFVAGSTSADSDIIAYIYDVTNSTLIEPSSIKLLSNSSSIGDKFVANFQTSATGASYRLILHCATTSASAYTLKLDSVRVGPSAYVYGTPITDWVSYTPTLLNITLGNGTSTGRWRRVGDSVELQTSLRFGSTTSFSASPNFAVPSGLVVDNTKLSASDTAVGSGWAIDASSGIRYVLSCFNNGANGLNPQSDNTSPLNSTVPFTWATGDYLDLFATLPISGWSSSSQVSDGYDGRLIAARYYASTGASMGTLSGSFSDVTFNTRETDTTASFSGATYTIPSSGYYKFSGQIYSSGSSTAGAVVQTKLLVDGSTNYSETVTNQSSISGAVGVPYNHGPFFFRAGQTVKLQAASSLTSPTYSTGPTQNYIQIEKLQAPTTISATEVVAARYTTTNNQSLTGAATTIVNYEVKTHDSHNATTVGAGAWKFTAPAPGFYKVQASIRAQAKNYSTGDNMVLYIYKNAAEYGWLGNWLAHTNLTSFPAYMGDSDTVYLNAGEYVDVRLFTNTTINLDNNSGRSHISVERIK